MYIKFIKFNSRFVAQTSDLVKNISNVFRLYYIYANVYNDIALHTYYNICIYLSVIYTYICHIKYTVVLYR